MLNLLNIIIPAAVGAVLTWLVTSIQQAKTFKNEYYKILIQKRIESYEDADAFLDRFRLALQDNKGRVYHSCFEGPEWYSNLIVATVGLIQKKMWLSDELQEQFRILNRWLHENVDSDDPLSFGIDNYEQLALWREKCERIYVNDLKTLYDIESFLNNKKMMHDFDQVKVYQKNQEAPPE